MNIIPIIERLNNLSFSTRVIFFSILTLVLIIIYLNIKKSDD